MIRRQPKRTSTARHVAAIPVDVLTSDAGRSLPNFALRLLLAIAAQCGSSDNGDLALTGSIARSFGIKSKGQLNEGIKLLLERGLIAKTRQGGVRPRSTSRYAVAWKSIKAQSGLSFSFSGLPAMDSQSNACGASPYVPSSAPSEDQTMTNQLRPDDTASVCPEDPPAQTSLPSDECTAPDGAAPYAPPSPVAPDQTPAEARPESAGPRKPTLEELCAELGIPFERRRSLEAEKPARKPTLEELCARLGIERPKGTPGKRSFR